MSLFEVFGYLMRYFAYFRLHFIKKNKFTHPLQFISLLQPALDALLAGEFKESMEDVFYSDDEDELLKRVKLTQTAKDVKMK